MVERILGLDINKNSIGWSLIEHDPKDDTNNLIVDCGVYEFKAGEIPKTGESPNTPRINARTQRNTIRKRRIRKNEIRKLFVEHGLFPREAIEDKSLIFCEKGKLSTPWELRKKALYEKLTPIEFGKALFHIAAHRGYQFTRAEEADGLNDGESGKLKEGGRALLKAYQDSGCLTIGEYISSLDRRRNRPQINEKKGTKESVYDRSIHRPLLKAEVEAIFETQQKLGNALATAELKAKYSDIVFFIPEPQSTERLIGKCTFFPEEKRAVKRSYLAERFVALTHILNCVVVYLDGGYEQKIVELKTIDELLELAYSSEEVKYSDLRKFLGLNEGIIFKGLKYDSKVKKAAKTKASSQNSLIPADEEVVLDFSKTEKKVFLSLKGWHEIKNAVSPEAFLAFDNATLDDISYILTVNKGEKTQEGLLANLLKSKTALPDSCLVEVVNSLIQKTNPKTFKDTVNLSLKALKIIIPDMEKGMRYDEAAAQLGAPTAIKQKLLPPLEKTDIYVNNPLVLRSVARLRKLVNAIIHRYGMFHKVHIETGKDMSTKKEKELIRFAQRERENAKKEAEKQIKELFGDSVKPSRKNIDKYRLWSQQDGKCLYTGDAILIERLYEDGYAKIDYILPRSRSFDESFGNMVLTLSGVAMDKGDKTAFELFGHDTGRWSEYKARVTSPSSYAKLGRGKVNRLIKENFNEQSAMSEREKRLEQARVYAAKVVKELFENYLDMPKSPNGGKQQVFTRNAWLTAELRRQWIGYDEQEKYMDARLPALNAVIVAFSGQKQVENLAQYFKWKETEWAKEKKQYPLPYDNFKTDAEKLLEWDRSHNDKNGKYRRRILISRAPNRTVTGQAHEVGCVSSKKYKGNAGVKLQNGMAIADHKDMVRLDVFVKDGKNAFVPIYVADMKKPLSNEALIAKGKKGFVADSEFKFSLFPGDMVSVGETMGSYLSFDRTNLNLTIKSDKEYRAGAIKSEILKFEVDQMGYISTVKYEKRKSTSNTAK